MSADAPTARQRRLAAELRRLREAARLTQAQAVRLMGWPDRTRLVRIEGAKQVPSIEDVERILEHYGPTNEAVRLALLQLARDVHRRGWWVAYGDILDGSYAELEDAATTIRIFQVQVIPGLLQTPAYARELITAEINDGNEIERRVQARMTRRTLLDRINPPTLDVIITEEILLRMIGGRPVTRQQISSLLRDLERPNITVRVLPLKAGAYPGQGHGGLTLFEMPANELDLSVAHLETMTGARYVEDIATVHECRMKFDRVASVALSPEDTASLLARMRKELE